MKYLLSTFILTIKSNPLYMDYQVQEDYIPILGYHDFGDIIDSLTITEERFKLQIDKLDEYCNWMTMERFSYYIKNKEKLPTKTCIINFDDGKKNQLLSVCPLNEKNIPATYYIASKDLESICIEKSTYMCNKDLEILNKIGHDIESHTQTHARLSDLSYSEQEIEILNSKKDLEDMGYIINTFAYPFGAYNEDTETIMKNSNYILGRDTSQDNSWKDPRAPIISYNENYLLHFFYIKPEELTAEELLEKVKYTGWWQFEDNYKLIKDLDGDVKVTSNSLLLPTDTSYAILTLYDRDDEISTQFITKYKGGFTLDLLLYNSTIEIGFKIKIDNIEYIPQAFEYYDKNSLKYTIGSYDYYNYYVNIDNLEPGVHILNVINTNGKKIYLDKYRLFSNINQEFIDTYEYNNIKCVNGTYNFNEENPDPTCENGLLNNGICCLSSCGQCGGSGCSSREGGSLGCCGGVIETSERYCNETSAPCKIVEEIKEEPDPTCENGLLDNGICCLSSCGECGGSGCSLREGGASGCCGGVIETSERYCNETSAPCKIVEEIIEQPDPTCENGIMKNNICCLSSCGECGGSGCSLREGGASGCCGSVIQVSERYCNETTSPCILY